MEVVSCGNESDDMMGRDVPWQGARCWICWMLPLVGLMKGKLDHETSSLIVELWRLGHCANITPRTSRNKSCKGGIQIIKPQTPP
jgi:hypothetical protein